MNNVKNGPSLPPILVLVIGVLAVSTSSIFIRLAQEEAPSLVIAAYRLTLAGLVLAPIALTRHRAELSALKIVELILALISGCFLALHFAAFISSLAYTSVASAVVLATSTPLWVALLAPIILKESLSRQLLTGLALAFLGSSVVGFGEACSWMDQQLVCPPAAELLKNQSFFGNFLALFAAWMAVGYLLIGRRLRSKVTLVAYIFLVYGMAALILDLIVLLAGQSPLGYPPQTYLWFLLLALVPQLLGHSTYNWALGHLSATYVSIAVIAEPVGSTILAYFILKESPSALEIFGAILILAGIYLASHYE
jgi:drug/metabolite transporter (DMT)-like permease